MQRPLALAVLVAAVMVSAPGRSPAQNPPNDQTVAGEQLFNTSCGFCHQAGGRADVPPIEARP